MGRVGLSLPILLMKNGLRIFVTFAQARQLNGRTA
jgi:hypothetical protein